MFNPNDHMMKLKGKDYLQVMWRLVWFREDHPDYTIDTQALELTENHAIFKCSIHDANGHQISAGHGSEGMKDFGDFIEKAETKAIGRALAMLGYGTQFAPELDEGDRIVDSPVKRESEPKETEKLELVPAAKTQDEARQEKLEMDAWKAAHRPMGFDLDKAMTAKANEIGVNEDIFKVQARALIKAGKLPKKNRMEMSQQDVDEIGEAVRKYMIDGEGL